ncbi:MAG: IS1595 family transposase [Planctomycetota bacterium]|jgi:transposase-like protein
MNYIQACKLDEDGAREYLESLRWPDGPRCVHCDSENVARLNGKATRPGVLKCRECRKQFTVTVNTIFHRSHIPLTKWVMAFCLICASKKGMSALQLQRMLGLASYQSAWHMAHRIRHAMQNEPLKGLLNGTVEVDETWIGSRVRGKGKGLKIENKTPVVALIQRDGPMRTRVLGRVTRDNLRTAVNDVVDRTAHLMTDERGAYRIIARDYKGHDSVCHTKGEYARGDAHCNTAESYFALLKRGIHGAFHHVGKQHLHRYCDEFAFRWNHRKATDAERTEAALRLAPGCRLLYR